MDDKKIYDTIILGAGPAGLSAAVYASRYDLKLLVIARDMGPISEADIVDNYLGFSSINGLELSQRFERHAKDLGIKVLREEVLKITKKENFIVKTNNNEYEARSIIYALGSKKRKLGLVEENRFVGRGVSYCTTCDAAFFKDKVVAVAGGSNSAAASALLLSQIASKVYIIYRRDKLRAFPHLMDEINNSKITIIFNTLIKKIQGENKVESVVVENVKTGDKKEIKLDGIFVEFGYNPNIELVKDLGVEISKKGEIKVNEDMSTNIKGFFAAGDVTTGSNNFQQAITAAAEGAIAAQSVYNFLGGDVHVNF